METPLVTVICLCYNQGAFLGEALQSIMAQSYPRIQLIVADDASTDHSRSIIRAFARNNPGVVYLPLANNIGNCKAFNQALSLAKGEFVVDFAADDVMRHDRIAQQVAQFAQLGPAYGIVYSDADYIDQNGRFIRNHKKHLAKHGLMGHMPCGDIFEQVLRRYFIAAPTVMAKRAVWQALGGYDESLAYEDFDFWVRAARSWHFAYLDKPLTQVRKLASSMSAHMYTPGDKLLFSTFKVCSKAQGLVKTQKEKEALRQRLQLELRQALFSENRLEARAFYGLLLKMGGLSLYDHLFAALARLALPMARMHKAYRYARYGPYA